MYILQCTSIYNYYNMQNYVRLYIPIHIKYNNRFKLMYKYTTKQIGLRNTFNVLYT